MSRIKVNLTLDSEVVSMARSLKLNMSRVAEAAIIEACKAEENRRWRAENDDAIQSYEREVIRDGVLSQSRSRGG